MRTEATFLAAYEEGCRLRSSYPQESFRSTADFALAVGGTNMGTAEMTRRIAEASPRLKARVAGVSYLLGVLMAIGGLAWLTDLSISLTDHLSPYNVISGFIGEGSLMLWLFVMGVNVQRWKEQASAARAGGGLSGS
jgi:hypothetical protein